MDTLVLVEVPVAPIITRFKTIIVGQLLRNVLYSILIKSADIASIPCSATSSATIYAMFDGSGNRRERSRLAASLLPAGLQTMVTSTLGTIVWQIAEICFY
jgi:hypothetical protein